MTLRNRLLSHLSPDAFIDNNDLVKPAHIIIEHTTYSNDENHKHSHSNSIDGAHVNDDVNSDHSVIVVESIPVAPASRARKPVTHARIPDPHALTARHTMHTHVSRDHLHYHPFVHAYAPQQ